MRVLPAVLCAAALLLAGCGDESGTAAAPTTTTSSAAGPTTTATDAGPTCTTPPAATDGIPALTGNPTDLKAPVTIEAGGQNPPTDLKTKDLVPGTGPVAQPTDTVNVQYSGALYCDGTLFDSSWERGAPASFPLDGVVPGFAQGIAGMAVGGRREMVIPPDLGYGEQGNGPVPGGATLVFVVDLVGIS